MNERNNEVLRAAAIFAARPEVRDDVKQAFERIPRSPLSLFIDEYLEIHAGIDFRSALQAIADLNQGTLEDLDSSAFQSYIIATTSVSEVQLRRCASALGSYRLLKERSRSNSVPLGFAAREDDGEPGSSASMNSELLEQLKKRTR